MAHSVELGNLEKVVDRLVKSGRYNSKSEILREGIRLIDEREKRLAMLDAALSRSLDEKARGRLRSADEVLGAARTHYARMLRDPKE
ncbi:type II toxin-antitoxin system ParD family antitoxin [Pleomorphomonas koreensis]|uniref:type II toxin-antitoxin system ParD family antitoxin n=1 Tax=Pleomorphomonas koreensis TaxID=257440 RepID=UPI00042005C7|nr:type II toxin-antitoxin system ParD family antitoxin [Pleomorphomonas koreensis]